jgi:hypothetical protein
MDSSEAQKERAREYQRAYQARKREERAAEATSSPIPDPSPAMPAALGRLAEAIVGNQATEHAFKAAENEITARWAATKSSERDEREDHYRDLQALRGLWKQIERLQAAGRIADIHDRKLRSV